MTEMKKTAAAGRKKLTGRKLLGNAGLFLLVLLAAVPTLWLIFLSLKTNNEILTQPLSLPARVQWKNYTDAFRTIPFFSMPLSYRGELIDKFSIRFREGKAVEWHAEVNEPLLTKIIEMDEGSHYLGECALVPYSSPIRESGLLFYNTLFDENAACHLALGMRDRLVTDLPQPDSPTTPTVEHFGMSNEMPSTALTVPMSVKK